MMYTAFLLGMVLILPFVIEGRKQLFTELFVAVTHISISTNILKAGEDSSDKPV